MNRTTTNSSASVFEHEGLLWKSKPEATSSFTQLLDARSTLREITQDSLWNPWVREEREQESDAALAVMEQWTRAEPGFRQMTEQEVDEMLAESDRRSAAAHAADVERWERDRQRYDPERESARLALLELSSRLKFVTEELARYGAMDSSRSSGWAWRIAELQQEAEKHPPEIERQQTMVGDPEDVVDAYGRLPRDRRSTTLLYYRLDRERDIRELRERVPALRTKLKSTTDRNERSSLRAKLQVKEHTLGKLLEVPPLSPDEMCAECATPASKHGWVSPPYDSPCPAWPGWGTRLEKVRQMMLEAVERTQPQEPDPPKPQPLALLPSGLAIAEVIEQLAKLQIDHPTAVVKRGRANRWELWPAGH